MSKSIKVLPQCNICNCLTPIFVISTAAGMCTISRTKNYYKFSYPAAGVCLFTLILGVVHLFFIPRVIMDMEKHANTSQYDDEEMKKSQHFITKMLNPLLVSMVGNSFRLIILLRMHNGLPFLLKLINDADNLLQTSRFQYERDSKWLLFSSIFFILLSWTFQIYSVISISSSYTQFALFFINLYNNFSATCSELHFCSFCFLIFRRFQALHSQLEQLKNVAGLRLMSDDKDVIKLKNIHRILCDACECQNKYFGSQLILSASCNFINILLNLFFAIFGGFKMPSKKGYSNAQPLSAIINDVIWAVYYFIKFSSTCIAADALANKGNFTKILIANLPRNVFNRKTKREIKHFFDCTSTRKITFTAGGFFKINLTLITSAIATGTTYLVILAQFNQSH